MNSDPSLNRFSIGTSIPKSICTPGSAQELAEFLAQCNAEQTSVVPWGGGTLQHVGNAPACYENVLLTTQLNHVVEYAADDLTATFGAGMTIDEISRVLNENGQFLPLDVPHPERATLGGVLAAGLNGPLRLRYGPARDYMLGSRFATVDGNIIKAGSKVVKNVAGYELHKVQVGALGTLGVLTEATFKLFPKPPAEIAVLASYSEFSDAYASIPLIWNLSTPPLAIEMLDNKAMRLVESDAGENWYVIARFGGTKVTMAVAGDLSHQIARENNAGTVSNIEDITHFWRSIADLPAALIEKYPGSLLLRVSVPPKAFGDAIKVIQASAAAQDIAAPRVFAHPALASIYASLEGKPLSLSTLVTDLRPKLHALGGHVLLENKPTTLTDLDAWEPSGGTFKMMQSLKKKFDPNNILNPGRFVGGI